MKLSKEQWKFLSVIDALGGSASIDIIGRLCPLTPGPLFDLLEYCESCGWIIKRGNKSLTLTDAVTQKAQKKIKAINNPSHLRLLINHIIKENLIDRIDKKKLAGLMQKAGKITEAAELEIDLARQHLEENKPDQGLFYLQRIADLLEGKEINRETGANFIAAVIDWLALSFAIGKVSTEIENIIQKALSFAEKIGDQRSTAVLKLHLGRHYYFTDRRDDALVALSLGIDDIETLGDKDIHLQSAALQGFYFFIQGRFNEAVKYLENVVQPNSNDINDRINDPLAPIIYGYSAAYLGKFHQAIGTLDFHCRMAESDGDRGYSSTLRSVLATILVLLRKHKKAQIHLDRARKEAVEVGNILGIYLSNAGISLNLFLKGNLEKAFKAFEETVDHGIKNGLIRQFASPWILEALYEYHQLGYPALPLLDFKTVSKRIMKGINYHLQGVCMRLQANMIAGKAGAHKEIENLLKQSLQKLEISQDPLQISKTLLELARLELVKGHRNKARELAIKARQSLGGYAEEFFPEEFLGLIEKKGIFLNHGFNEEKFLNQFLEMVESLYPSKDRMEILTKMFSATSQMFGAERSGLFWFPEGEFTNQPELRAALNLPKIEMKTSSFKSSIVIILETQKKNCPLSKQVKLKEFTLKKQFVRSILCIPIEVTGAVHGVLYYDNSYLENAFDFLNMPLIKRMANHTNMVIEKCIDHLEIKDKAEKLSNEKSLLHDGKSISIITQSKKIHTLLKQITQIAATESTILILGETGTGKELIAKYIHNNSLRRDEPFIIVDPTTIPENLFESELFGHEKGSFTGADKRKIGSIEMADKGTLFLDEVGELTLQSQAKLLRALQEKTIRRVGGVNTIKADFRLIAATNRNLAQLVQEGKFREDLFYRLNVVPFELPPLRERDKDSAVLAQYYIDRYTRKYNMAEFKLTANEKTVILNYHWPGNIRELKNVFERAVLLSDGNRLELDLPLQSQNNPTDPFIDNPTLDEIQRRYIKYILEMTNGKISGTGGACEILGLKRTSLYSKMKALNFQR